MPPLTYLPVFVMHSVWPSNLDLSVMACSSVWKDAFGHAAGQRRGDCVNETVGGRLAAFMRQRVAQLSAARDRERVRVCQDWWSSQCATTDGTQSSRTGPKRTRGGSRYQKESEPHIP